MSKSSIIWLLIGLLVHFRGEAVEIPLVELDEFSQVINPAYNFAYCISDSGLRCTDEGFQILTRDVLSKGFTNSDVVLQTRLFHASDIKRSYKLELGNPSLNDVQIEITSGKDTLYNERFGDLIPFNRRSFFHRNFILSFTMEPFQKVDVKITISAQRESIFLPLRICSERHFYKSTVVEFLLMGGIIGMYAVYVLFILGLFLLWRSKLFLYYALANLFVLLYCLFDTGYGFQFLWPSLPVFQKMVIPVIAFAYLIALISFTRDFFSTPIKYPSLDKLLIGFMGLNVLVFIAVIIMYNMIGMSLVIPLFLLVSMFLIFGVISTSLGAITYLQSGRREGFWFLFLFSLYLLMFALILHQKGYLGFFIIPPDSPIYYHLPLFTSTPHYIFVMMLVEMLSISAVIAFRFQDVLEEYNVTQRRIEDVNLNSIKAFINGQEVERESLAIRLQRKIGMDLTTIEHDLNQVINSDPGHDGLDSSLTQLHGVREDLQRIASDFVIDWSKVDFTELIDRVCNELKMVLPELDVDVSVGPRIDRISCNDLTKLNVYRIMQEACNNIIKHAGSSKVQVVFETSDGVLELVIDDNGVGFDPEKVVLKKGIGLRNIETRVNALNGSIDIISGEGKGTRISISIPVSDKSLVK